MSNLTQAMAMLGPAAFMTGAASLLLPRAGITLYSPSTHTPLRYGSNALLGPLLGLITLSVLCLLPGPFNPDPGLEILYLLGGFIAIFTTLAALATLIGAVLYRIRHRRRRTPKTPKPPTR